MKYLFSLTLAAVLVLGGCQQADQSQPEEEAKEPGKLIVHEIQEDGSSQEIMTIDLPDPDNAAVILPGTKGMVINDDGFAPSELTITAGSKVIFENMGEQNHWPASGFHPIHDVCPGFDAGKALKPGEVYEFTFTEAKECPVHDHLNPQFQGKITVVAE